MLLCYDDSSARGQRLGGRGRRWWGGLRFLLSAALDGVRSCSLRWDNNFLVRQFPFVASWGALDGPAWSSRSQSIEWNESIGSDRNCGPSRHDTSYRYRYKTRASVNLGPHAKTREQVKLKHGQIFLQTFELGLETSHKTFAKKSI
jgi:hypothetical protein